MSLDILLKDNELSDRISLAKDQYKTVLQTQRSILKSVFGSDTSSEVKLADKASLLLAGVYGVVKNKLTNNPTTQKNLSQSTQNAYALFVASEAIIQNVNLDISAFNYPSYMEQNYSKYLELEAGDFNVVSQAVSGFHDYTKNHKIYNDIDFMLTHYYSRLSESIIDHIYRASSDSISMLNDLQVVGNRFKVEGLNGVKRPMQTFSKEVKNRHEKGGNSPKSTVEEVFRVEPPPMYLGQEISFDEVIGNERAKKHLQDKIFHLMAYSIKEKKNPFKENNKKYTKTINLIGLPGCGKTLMLDAAQSYANGISRNFNRPYDCVALDFGSGTQDGPMEKLKYQLQTISNPEKIYLVFIDEAEKIFPRDRETSHGIERKVGRLMLDFINGKSFKDYGNHLMVFASNEPAIMSPALKSRLNGTTYLCEGPMTAEQKQKVLYLNLKALEVNKCLKVNDWKTIGKMAYDWVMTGRELGQVGGNLIESAEQGIEQYPMNFFKLEYGQMLELTSPRYKLVTDKEIINEMYNIISNRKNVKDISDQFQTM